MGLFRKTNDFYVKYWIGFSQGYLREVVPLKNSSILNVANTYYGLYFFDKTLEDESYVGLKIDLDEVEMLASKRVSVEEFVNSRIQNKNDNIIALDEKGLKEAMKNDYEITKKIKRGEHVEGIVDLEREVAIVKQYVNPKYKLPKILQNYVDKNSKSKLR